MKQTPRRFQKNPKKRVSDIYPTYHIWPQIGNSLCSLVSCQMLQIFSRWRCDNWVSVFKIIFASLGLLLYQNQKFHEQHDKNMYHPKNHPKNLWVCNRIWQVKKSWIIHPSILVLHSQQQCCCKNAQKISYFYLWWWFTL